MSKLHLRYLERAGSASGSGSSRVAARGCLFLLFAIVCLVQCYSIMSSYFQYPVAVDMYDLSPNLSSILPGVTICNNNRLSLRFVMRKNANIARTIGERFPEWYQHNEPQLGLRKFDNFRDEIFRIYQNLNYTAQDDIDNTTLADSFKSRPDSQTFIKYLGCAQAWSDSVECGQLSRVESVQDRRCTTLMHRGALAHDYQSRPHLFNSIVPNETVDFPYGFFNARDVIKMIINFAPEDYGDLKRQVGARIVFHSNTFVASFNELDFFITRGYRYDFNIDREEMLLPNKPYAGCWDYEEKNLEKFKAGINPRIPLDVNTCFQNCVITNILSRLNCWPPIMPYFQDDPLDPERKYRACTWNRDTLHSNLFSEILRVLRLKKMRELRAKGQLSNKTSQADKQEAAAGEEGKSQLRLFKRIRRHCWRRCMVGCRMMRYTVSVSRTVWPTDLRITLDKTGRNLRLRHCCALMTVKYPHFHHTVQEFIPKYNLIDTIGNVGGLLAVWLGLSMISIYHAIQKLLEFSNKRWACRRKVAVAPNSTKLIHRNVRPSFSFRFDPI